MSGAMPQRAQGDLAGLPDPRHRQVRLEGLRPADAQTADYLPFAKHPQAVDPDYLVSWNNKQAPGWAAADDKYDYGPLYRSQMIADQVNAADIKGGKKMTIAQLVQAMEEPATEDLRGYRLLPLLVKAIGKPKSAKLQERAGEAEDLAQGTAPTAATSTATASTRKRRRSS